MNLSEMLTSIKMDLGVYGIALPLDNVDEKLYEVIKLKSLKTFSVYFPNNFQVELDIPDLDFIRHSYDHTIFRLPDIFSDRRLVSVRNVTYADYNRSVGYATSPEMVGGLDLYQGMMMGSAVAHINSAITPPFTFKFESPNLVHLYNFSTIATKLRVDVCLEHTDNLMTIPNAAFLSFYDLALLDIKIFLFNIVKHFDQLSSPYGTVNLRINDWESAIDKREELVNLWKARSHLNGEQFIIA